jgi:hypothetical protein
VPGVAGYWDTRAVCAAASGDAADAEASWRRALDLYAADTAAPASARSAAALRFANFLTAQKRADDARGVARAALAWASGTPSAAELGRLAGN